ncbi:MAG: hypothetical protein V4613_12210 [Bacteroidota bacterium]
MFHEPVPYINRKNGKTYHKIGEAIDCTNGNEDVPFVIYCLPDNDKTFIRKATEFEQKFYKAES